MQSKNRNYLIGMISRGLWNEIMEWRDDQIDMKDNSLLFGGVEYYAMKSRASTAKNIMKKKYPNDAFWG